MSEIVAVMPTLGRSPHLGNALEALAGEDVPVILVGPREVVGSESRPSKLVETNPVEIAGIVPTDVALGFAEAVNRGLASKAARAARWVALVNDDAIVQPGWAAHLLRAAEASPEVASAQGLVLRMDRPELVDGAGIAWNSWWQAVQLGHLHAVEPFDEAEPFEIFGASATAAVFRRCDLDALAHPAESPRDGEPEIFDRSLDSYYEDVDLAIRLRAAGRHSLCVPAARALHAGSTTGSTLSQGRETLVRRNRYPILARLLGSGLWRSLPHAVLRDLVDVLRLLRQRRFEEAKRVGLGTLQGLLRLSREIRLHRPRVDPADCRGRFGAELGPT